MNEMPVTWVWDKTKLSGTETFILYCDGTVI